MTVNKKKTSVVQDRLPYGVFVWRTDDGRVVGDDDNNYLMISVGPGMDKRAAKLELERAVRYYGIVGGQAEWRPGARRVTDEEYAHQKQRLEWGLTPDPMDVMPELDEVIRRHTNGE